jgi:hypothetical protein
MHRVRPAGRPTAGGMPGVGRVVVSLMQRGRVWWIQHHEGGRRVRAGVCARRIGSSPRSCGFRREQKSLSAGSAWLRRRLRWDVALVVEQGRAVDHSESTTLHEVRVGKRLHGRGMGLRRLCRDRRGVVPPRRSPSRIAVVSTSFEPRAGANESEAGGLAVPHRSWRMCCRLPGAMNR